VAVFEVDAKAGIGEYLGYAAVHFKKFFFGHVDSNIKGCDCRSSRVDVWL
jgi:hypothetical protein